MKRIFGIVLGAMLIAGCTQKKTEEKAEWRSVDPMEFTTQPIDLLANRWMALLPAEEREGRYTRMGMHTFYIGEILNIWEK